jgi:hypothetical protein
MVSRQFSLKFVSQIENMCTGKLMKNGFSVLIGGYPTEKCKPDGLNSNFQIVRNLAKFGGFSSVPHSWVWAVNQHETGL